MSDPPVILPKPTSLLWDTSPSAAGARPHGEGPIRVRPYPFPFIAAFSLSNDVDGMNLAAFEDWHGFVSGRGKTAYGDGLGLEVGDSFWVWGGPTDILAIHRQYPGEDQPVDSPDVPRIAELAKAGWLDTLHSLGNWRSPADGDRAKLGQRDQAAYALDKLDNLGVRPGVFVNHSASPSNVGAIWGSYQRADDPDHPMYCLDLYRQFGFRYYWVDAATSINKFGDHLQFFNKDDYQARLAAFPFVDWLRKAGKRAGDDPPIFPRDESQQRCLFSQIFNETLIQVAARDGTPILAFKRYRSPELPTTSTFPTQVTARKLDELEQRGGAVVVYQHFGVTSLRGRGKIAGPGGGKARSVPPVLDEHEAACWRDIAARRDSGRLFVATTRRLLDWLWLRDRLEIHLDASPGRWRVRLGPMRCHVLGDLTASVEWFNGLSLLVPEHAPEVLVHDDQNRPVALSRRSDPAFPGSHVLHRPWLPLEWVPA